MHPPSLYLTVFLFDFLCNVVACNNNSTLLHSLKNINILFLKKNDICYLLHS